MTRLWGPLVVAACFGGVLWTGPAGAQAGAPQEVLTLAVPNRANAHVSAAARGTTVALVWAATSEPQGTDIYAAMSRDGGASFSMPARVNHLPGDARVNVEQPPRVALVPRAGAAPAIVVVWTARRDGRTALLQAQSNDGGRTFSAATSVAGSDGAGNRGWESIAATPGGALVTAWLDHRETVAATAAPAPHAHAGGSAPSTPAPAAAAHDAAAHASTHAPSMTERSKLYVAGPGAVGGRPVAAGVCYCCKTATAVAPDGAIYVAWRHVYPGDFRDIAFTTSRDGGRSFTAPVRVNQDGWSVNGCPENGPALAIDAGNRVHLAWPTMVAGTTPALGLFYTSVVGVTVGPRQRVPTDGTPGHVQVAIDGRSRPVLVWDESMAGVRRVRLARLDEASGRFAAASTVADRGAAPAIATTDTHVVVAWVGGSNATAVIQVTRLPAR